MTDQPIDLEAERPPDVVLPPEPEAALLAMAEALNAPRDGRKAAVAAVVAEWPRYLDAWAHLGELTDDPLESYAYFRVGYHRGLDKLRASGWRGRGFVRWSTETNRGFLRALTGLSKAASRIGERDEVDRIGAFLEQLDPDRPEDL